MLKKIAFIGAGSMAEAIISGLVADELVASENVFVTNRQNTERLIELEEKYGVTGTQDKQAVIEGADAVIISPKPHDIEAALLELKGILKPGQLLISVVAGVSSDSISELIGEDIGIVRVMPNTSAMIGESASGVVKGPFATAEQLAIAEEIFKAVGTVAIIKEEEMHALTSISGSGPAYFYYIAEIMEEAAVESGLDANLARELVAQTIVGAGKMLQTSADDARELRRKVTSPNGTTEAGIRALQSHELDKAIKACVQAAQKRSKELGE